MFVFSASAHLLTTRGGNEIEKADTEINPDRLFFCPLEPEADDRGIF